MNIERDTAVEIAISTVAVVLFALVIIVISSTYYTDGFSPNGAIALVISVGAFVLVMSYAGYFILSR